MRWGLGMGAQWDKTPLKHLHADDRVRGNMSVTSRVSLLPLPASPSFFTHLSPLVSSSLGSLSLLSSSRQSLYTMAGSRHNIMISDGRISSIVNGFPQAVRNRHSHALPHALPRKLCVVTLPWSHMANTYATGERNPKDISSLRNHL